MKIALLRQRVTALGGAETTLNYLVRGLAAAGHEVSVYGTERAAAAQAALGPGVAYVRVPVWGGKTLRLLTFALNSRRLLKDAGPQVVFSLERVPGLPRSTGPETAATGNFCPAAPRISRPWPGPPRAQPLSPGDAHDRAAALRLSGALAGDRQLPAGAGRNHPALWGGPGPPPGYL